MVLLVEMSKDPGETGGIDTRLHRFFSKAVKVVALEGQLCP